MVWERSVFTRSFLKRLNDRKQLQVNVANGNLVLQAQDLLIHGTGIDLAISSTYNSQSTATTALGQNWNLSLGSGIWLTTQNGTVTLHGSSGFAATFPPYQNGYQSPPGLDARLFLNQDNSHTLVYEKTGECFGFDPNGRETFDEDKNNNAITFVYDGSGTLTSLTDTQNRVTTFGYNPRGQLNLITDPIGRTVQYHYDPGTHLLSSSVDTMGQTTSFAYTGTHLTAITDPNGKTTTISYTNNQVTRITDATTAQTTYAYLGSGSATCTTAFPNLGLPCTTVTDDNGHTTTYAYSGMMVQKVLDANHNLASKQYTPDGNVSQYPTRSWIRPSSVLIPPPTI